MLLTARKCAVAVLCAIVLVASAACSNFDLAGPSAPTVASAPADSPAPVYGSASDPWTTPPGPGSPQYGARPAPRSSLQPAPQPLPATARPATWPSGAGRPPPPPPPPDTSIPVMGAPQTMPMAPAPTPATVAAQPAPTSSSPRLFRRVVPQRARQGCGLHCEEGISRWHVRGVMGAAFFAGDDPAENCLYWGADIGRTFCGCWGLDAYYRYNSGRFDLLTPPGLVKDGGGMHHVGAKLTYERGFGQGSRFYWWGGLGAGYFWTEDYFVDDSGIEGYGEAGVGYVINNNFRVRVGVNVHAMDTNVTRRLAWPVAPGTNDRSSRLLWVIAPVGQIEIDF